MLGKVRGNGGNGNCFTEFGNVLGDGGINMVEKGGGEFVLGGGHGLI